MYTTAAIRRFTSIFDRPIFRIFDLDPPLQHGDPVARSSTTVGDRYVSLLDFNPAQRGSAGRRSRAGKEKDVDGAPTFGPASSASAFDGRRSPTTKLTHI